MLGLFIAIVAILILGTIVAIATSFKLFMDTITEGDSYGNKERNTINSTHRER